MLDRRRIAGVGDVECGSVRCQRGRYGLTAGNLIEQIGGWLKSGSGSRAQA
jgi:hypothetical protein